MREKLETTPTPLPRRLPWPRILIESYVGRVLRLTLLAPDIVEVILGGRQSAVMTPAVPTRPISVEWREQRKTNFCWKNNTSVAARRTQHEVVVQSRSTIDRASSPF